MYKIVKCSTEKTCPKCSSFGDLIAVKRDVHTTLYCAKCGAFVKHASAEDMRHAYYTKVSVEDLTPVSVGMLYIESEKSFSL